MKKNWIEIWKIDKKSFRLNKANFKKNQKKVSSQNRFVYKYLENIF